MGAVTRLQAKCGIEDSVELLSLLHDPEPVAARSQQ